MKTKVECPYCDGIANLAKKPRELNYRKEDFRVVEHFYKCAKCNEEFTTTGSDSLTIIQMQNLYREKHKIPYPEEIAATREQYEIPAIKMSEVLGLGVNGYGNYEKGEIPTEGYGNLIRLAGDPQVFKGMLENARNHFSTNAFRIAMDRVDFLIAEKKNFKGFIEYLNLGSHVSRYTGFRKVNLDKVLNVLTFFVTKCKEEYNDKLKLNKLFFYADFLNYKKTGLSITGISYRAIPYGPVPSNYDFIFAYYEREGYIESKWTWLPNNPGKEKEIFITSVKPDLNVFTVEETETLHELTELFKDTTSSLMVEISHQEKAWIELHSERKIIDYQEYAFDLVGA